MGIRTVRLDDETEIHGGPFAGGFPFTSSPYRAKISSGSVIRPLDPSSQDATAPTPRPEGGDHGVTLATRRPF